MKAGTIGLLVIGIIVTLPVLQIPSITPFAFNGQGPVFAGPLFPFVFITIVCGTLSGFHALIATVLLNPGVYFAMSAGAGVAGSTPGSATTAVTNLGFSIRAESISNTASNLGESSLVAHTGGAPTLAVAMSEI